jgi:UDP-glucose 4-epimerase
MVRCLVTGAGGFIGSHLVGALQKDGHSVRAFDQLPRPLDLHLGVEPEVEWIQGDFRARDQIANAVSGCELCYHLVSTTIPKSSNDDPIYDVQSNLVSTIQFLEEAARAGVRKVIFLSSGGTVYGTPRYTPIDEAHPNDPTNSYGIIKLAIEKYLALYRQLRGLEYVVLRLSNPYGERQPITGNQGVVAVFMGKVLRGEAIEIWGDGSIIRDYVYIGDVVEALLRVASYGGAERIFNIGSGAPLALNAVIDSIGHVTGMPIKRRYLPGRSFDVPVSVLSIERAREQLGWAPRTPFLDGLARTRDWVLAQCMTIG